MVEDHDYLFTSCLVNFKCGFLETQSLLASRIQAQAQYSVESHRILLTEDFIS